MGMFPFSLFFDYKSFLSRTPPILETLKSGSSSEVRKLAMEIATRNPKVWTIVSCFGATRGDNDFLETNFNGFDIRTSFWIVLIMSEYCSTGDDRTDAIGAKTIGKTITEIGLDEESQMLLSIGRPFSSIFSSLDEITSKIPTDDNFSFTDFDNFRAGWLSIEDIESIQAKLQVPQENINHPARERLRTILEGLINSKRGLIVGVGL